jgi:hypothetical protein
MSQQLTPNFALPYYQGSDPADGATQQQALAVKLDTVLKPFAPVTVTSLVGDVGQTAQARAGRQLALSDFTSLGLSAPRGLWNLSDLTDASGNGRSLTNKNAVGFGLGINGAAATAAQFRGATGTPANDPALYIADTGVADPFRIPTGSWGCWFRTAKRGILQDLVTKESSTNQRVFGVTIGTANIVAVDRSVDGSTGGGASGVSDVCDDRWHHGVATYDGTVLRNYVDGVLEATSTALSGAMFAGSGPFNIGARYADSGTATTNPFYGRVDEAFVTADVLSEDQVRFLYAARLVHTLGAQPKTVSLNVRRQRRGAALATTDFSTGPLRLYNFTQTTYDGTGGFVDAGSNGQNLTNSGTVDWGVAGADGGRWSAFNLRTTPTGHLLATDAGLPSALLARSYGCWFKTTYTAGSAVAVAWGTPGHVAVYVLNGAIRAQSATDDIAGGFVADGQWHFVVCVEDNTAGDGLKRKLYSDGRLVNGSMVLNPITLAGANRFRVGAYSDGSLPFTGQIDGAFVTGYAMTTDEVLRLYAKASQAMPSSPKNSGDHVEAVDSGSVLVVADTLDAQHYIDLTLA